MEEIILSALLDILGCGDTVEVGDREQATELAVERLQKAGYGNVKQAIKKFAEWVIDVLDTNSYANEADGINASAEELKEMINTKIKELYGE